MKGHKYQGVNDWHRNYNIVMIYDTRQRVVQVFRAYTWDRCFY